MRPKNTRKGEIDEGIGDGDFGRIFSFGNTCHFWLDFLFAFLGNTKLDIRPEPASFDKYRLAGFRMIADRLVTFNFMAFDRERAFAIRVARAGNKFAQAAEFDHHGTAAL